MRKIVPLQTVVIGTAIVAAATMGPRPGVAQNAPWCLVNDQKGSTSCTFATREQCMLSTAGNVGHCVANPAGPPPRAPARVPRRQND